MSQQSQIGIFFYPGVVDECRRRLMPFPVKNPSRLEKVLHTRQCFSSGKKCRLNPEYMKLQAQKEVMIAVWQMFEIPLEWSNVFQHLTGQKQKMEISSY